MPPVIGKVLVVDDDRDLLSALSEMLEAAGWQVIAARSVDEAIVALRAQRVDVVLTDILMPERDGRSFVALLRREAALASIPVVFMTGSLRHARELPSETVISKPFDVSHLLEVLRNQLAGR